MNKADVVVRVKQLNFPADSYWVVAGAAMVLYGLRENTNDIDLGCTKALADVLEDRGYPTKILPDGTRRISVAEDVEIFEDWLYDGVISMDGIPVITLKGLLEMKRSLGREKDLVDIRLIESALMK